MASDFEPILGTWWAVGAPDVRISGYLDLTSDIDAPWRLVLAGQLTEWPEPGHDRHMTVLGRGPQGEFTLRFASHTVNRGYGRTGEDVVQVWRAREFLRGGHEIGQDHHAVEFELPHLLAWRGHSQYSEWNGGMLSDRNLPPILGAQLHGARSIYLGASSHGSFRDAGESWEVRGRYRVTGRDGVTLDGVASLVTSLTWLQGIMISTPVEPRRIMMESGPRPIPSLAIVDPRQPADSGLRYEPFLDATDVDFEQFMRQWTELGESAPSAMRAASPSEQRLPAESQLAEVCKGIEALDALISPAPELDETDKRALAALDVAGLPGHIKRYVRSQLKMHHRTLPIKLASLAQMMGAESAQWLLGPSLAEWAQSVAQLRNAHAHGLPLPGGMKNDVPFLVTSLRSVTAVLKLSLLAAAGYSNRDSAAPGELLRGGGVTVTPHPDSLLFYELEAIASYSDHWSGWHRRLHP